MSKEDVRRIVSAGPFLPEFRGAEMLVVRFRTDRDVVANILPPPLRAPAGDGYGLAFVGWYPATNFGLSYREGALSVDASYRGEVGLHCLAMPVDDDIALVLGREEFGYPKKLADHIGLERVGDQVTGSVVRHGTEILRAEAELGSPTELGSVPVLRAGVDLNGTRCLVATSWLFKYFPSVKAAGFEGAPKLVRAPIIFRPRPGLRSAEVDLKLISSVTDPLGDVPVLDVVGAWYGEFDNTMLPGRTVRRIRNPYPFARRSLARFDIYSLMDKEEQRPLSVAERMRLRRRLRRY